MPTTKEMQAQAKIARKCFVRDQRADGTHYYHMQHDTQDLPQWVRDMVYSVHHAGTVDLLPDDYKYEYIVDALDAIDDVDEDAATLRDEINLEADIYTSDLVRWVASHPARLAYCDAFAEEMGHIIDGDDGDSTESRLSGGQYAEKREVLDAVLSAVEEQAREVRDAVEDEETEEDA